MQNKLNKFDDKINKNIPWLAQEAITFIDNYINKIQNPKILEFGSGSSTIWFAKKTTNLVSLEDNKLWFDIVNKTLSEKNLNQNVNIKLIELYYYACSEFKDEYFDLVLIDGKDRLKCLEASIRILKKGGLLILDNTERHWYKKAYQILDGWQLFEFSENSENKKGKTSCWIKP